MNRQQAAVLRLVASRERLRGVLSADADVGTLGALLIRLVRRFPWGSAVVSMLAGAVLARARPWRWVLKPEILGALLPTLMTTLASAPLSAWSGLLSAFLSQVAPATDAAPMPHPVPSPVPHPVPHPAAD